MKLKHLLIVFASTSLSIGGAALYLWLSWCSTSRDNGVFEEVTIFTSTHLVLRDGRFFYLFQSDGGGLGRPTVGDYTREGDAFVLRTDRGEFARWSLASKSGDTLLSPAGVTLHLTDKSVDDVYQFYFGPISP